MVAMAQLSNAAAARTSLSSNRFPTGAFSEIQAPEAFHIKDN